MKMLKKLAALILAATMVLVLFTACGGDTTSTPEAQAEAQMMSTINAKRPEGKKLENNAQCRAIASQHIDAEHEMDTGWRCCQSCEWSDLHGYLGGY